MKATLQKQGDCFFPYDDESLELTQRKRENSLYVVDIKEARNPQYHKYAMKMLHILHDMVEEPKGFEPFRKRLLILSGYFISHGSVDINGTTSVAVEAESMSYENMEQDEFRKCFQNILQAFCDEYGKSLTLQQLGEWARM